ncbi:MAG: hypothetical protein M3381_02760, partial [Actinomycetota bacterium]|nr:hypothetical protein [Actinomycetota bacterium]
MVADGDSLDIQRARLRDGRVCDITVRSGRVSRIVESSPGRVKHNSESESAAVPVIEAEGRLVTESFVDGHLHLDKVYTLP